jgi:hypothetical protein
MQRFSRVFFAVALVGWLCVAPAGAAASAQSQVTLTVSVVDGDGAAVGGAEITASWEGGRTTATTASNGRAFVDVPAGADVTLEIDHEEFVRNEPVVVEDAAETDVTVEVAPKGRATARVNDTDGDPLSGATVEFSRDGTVLAEGETDEDGTFDTGVLERGYYDVRAVKPGYHEETRRIRVGIDSRHEFELRRGSGRLDIAVVDDHYEEPRELEDARVRLTDAEGEVATVRTSGGTASLSVPVNTRYRLTVLKEGYVEDTTRVVVRESDRSVQATTQRLPALHVQRQNDRVVVGEETRLTVGNAYQEAVEGAEIRYRGETVAETDANGEAVVTVEGEGSQEFSAVRGDVESEPVTVQGVDPAGDGPEPASPTATEAMGPGFGAVAARHALSGAAWFQTVLFAATGAAPLFFAETSRQVEGSRDGSPPRPREDPAMTASTTLDPAAPRRRSPPGRRRTRGTAGRDPGTSASSGSGS